ncbi:Predicted N-acyltransferase, GNAT family [Haloarcula vallismortis]|uniref:Acetyltransferase n=2 Tax=Haloarcula vallismortis TaxID=28442 RepID=M0J0B3_HALVA|nr:GNAT family N-acetyltransferase [Haloarcula vallismortis]EMA01793.1 acetyltransferase [Haloarcula vallismortis ATCC 29715]SDW53497.1 Predicted N-acyltransferase, GNAT family [Haloarcula vallismortis]
MSDFEVDVGTWNAFADAATAVRKAVFVEEQGVSENEELDGNDSDAVQFLARDGEYPVGTARLRFPEPTVGKVERVAVRQPYRGDGVGTALMRAVEDAARDDGATVLKLHAQTHVEPFYEQLGYETVSDEFEEAGIPHIEMRKRLDG